MRVYNNSNDTLQIPDTKNAQQLLVQNKLATFILKTWLRSIYLFNKSVLDKNVEQQKYFILIKFQDIIFQVHFTRYNLSRNNVRKNMHY